MLIERRKDRLLVDTREFGEYFNKRLLDLADTMTNFVQSFTLIIFTLVCVCFNAPPYVYMLVIVLPFLTKDFLTNWLNHWLHRQFHEIRSFLN